MTDQWNQQQMPPVPPNPQQQWPQPQQQQWGQPYPPQYQYQPPKKKPKWPWIVGGVFLVLVVAAVAAGGDEDNSTAVREAPRGANTTSTVAEDNSSTVATTSTIKSDGAYALGVEADTANLKVTVFGFVDNWKSTASYDKPDLGRYVAVDFQVTNTRDDGETFYTFSNVELVTSDNRVYEPTTVLGDYPEVDGPLPLNSPRRGYAIFDIPPAGVPAKVLVRGDTFASGALFNLS